jgi:Uma2 family endonuclease
MSAITVTLTPVIELSDDAFYELCQNNRELRFERTAMGDLIIMPPVGGEGSSREAEAIIQLGIWNKHAKLGIVFSSSGGFKLPNGADRSPDAAWIERSRWEALPLEQRRKFPPIAPDFVIELRSETDELKSLQDKMQEYIENGVKLGWLLNPQDRQIEIYQPGQPVEVLNSPSQLSGEPLLPHFVLDLSEIFS